MYYYISYPNPVSNLVIFDIHLENFTKVNLQIFNNLGQLAATIVDQAMEKGDHQVKWDAEDLSPGIYFYRISMYGQISTGKLVIVR